MCWWGFLSTASGFLGSGTAVPVLPWPETGRGTRQRWGELCNTSMGWAGRGDTLVLRCPCSGRTCCAGVMGKGVGEQGEGAK